jgi:hypothetical protein
VPFRVPLEQDLTRELGATIAFTMTDILGYFFGTRSG